MNKRYLAIAAVAAFVLVSGFLWCLKATDVYHASVKKVGTEKSYRFVKEAQVAFDIAVIAHAQKWANENRNDVSAQKIFGKDITPATLASSPELDYAVFGCFAQFCAEEYGVKEVSSAFLLRSCIAGLKPRECARSKVKDWERKSAPFETKLFLAMCLGKV